MNLSDVPEDSYICFFSDRVIYGGGGIHPSADTMRMRGAMSTILELSPEQAQMSPEELDFGRSEARVSAAPATTGTWEYSIIHDLLSFTSNVVISPGGDDWNGDEEAQTECHH